MSDNEKTRIPNDIEKASAYVQAAIDDGSLQTWLESFLADEHKDFKVPFALLIPHTEGVHTLTNLDRPQLLHAMNSVVQDITADARLRLAEVLAAALSGGKVVALGPFTIGGDDDEAETPSDGKVH